MLGICCLSEANQWSSRVMRRKSRQIRVGNVAIGGDAPIAVQSMTTTYTRDVESTVAQIHRLEDVGCEIVRVAVPEKEDALAIGEIKKHIHIPLVADIHYKHTLALEAIRQGIDCVRINPGNLINGRTSLEQIITACKERSIAMRIGVNSGSIDALDQRGQMQRIQVRLRDDGILERTDPAEARRKEREHLAERMVNKALEYISWCEAMDFHEIKVSLKSSTPLTAVEAYRRLEIDVISVANEVEKRLSKVQPPIHVAVMGCVVNGPGESRDADVGLAGGKGRGVIFRKGEVVKTVPEDQFLDAVLKEVASLLPEREARLVYPEGGIQETAGVHRTRDEGIGERLAKS